MEHRVKRSGNTVKNPAICVGTLLVSTGLKEASEKLVTKIEQCERKLFENTLHLPPVTAASGCLSSNLLPCVEIWAGSGLRWTPIHVKMSMSRFLRWIETISAVQTSFVQIRVLAFVKEVASFVFAMRWFVTVHAWTFVKKGLTERLLERTPLVVVLLEQKQGRRRALPKR